MPNPPRYDAWGYPIDEQIHPADSGVISPGVPDFIRRLYEENPWDTLRGDPASAPATAPEPPPAFTVPPPKTVQVDPDRMVRPFVPPPPAPAAETPVDPYQEAIDKLSKYFGTVPVVNPKQDEADAWAAREKNRTALLAQLAFAGGLTAAGGAGWEQVGKGFLAAGIAYDEGFQRYSDALQNSADQYSTAAERNETRRLAIAKAGIDLVESEKERQRKTWQDTLDSIDERFGKEMDAVGGDFGADPAVLAEIQRRWELARKAGKYIPTHDVSDA